MRLRKMILALPVLALLALGSIGGCSGENSLADGGETPGPGPGGPEEATTLVTGTVSGGSDCNGIAGIATGDVLEIQITSTGANTGNATVMVNGGSGGTVECATQGSDVIDSPPVSFIGCNVTSVSGGITGIAVNDQIGIGITFDFNTMVKSAGVVVNESACVEISITSLVAES